MCGFNFSSSSASPPKHRPAQSQRHQRCRFKDFRFPPLIKKLHTRNPASNCWSNYNIVNKNRRINRVFPLGVSGFSPEALTTPRPARSSGFRPGEDIEIVFTGLRAGEKLFEELSIKGEDMQPTRHPKIVIWKNIPMDRDKLQASIGELLNVARTQDDSQVAQKIKQLVPEYTGRNNYT